jgi:hypothetical protein
MRMQNPRTTAAAALALALFMAVLLLAVYAAHRQGSTEAPSVLIAPL